MRIILILIVSVLTVSLAMQEAESHMVEKKCTVSKNPISQRIIYDKSESTPTWNPDETFYPGDKGHFELKFRVSGEACVWGRMGVQQVWDAGAVVFSNDEYGDTSKFPGRMVTRGDSDDGSGGSYAKDRYFLKDDSKRVQGHSTTVTISGEFEIDPARANDCHGKPGVPEDYLWDNGGINGYGGDEGWKHGRNPIPNDKRTNVKPPEPVKTLTILPVVKSGDLPQIIDATVFKNKIVIKFSESVTAKKSDFGFGAKKSEFLLHGQTSGYSPFPNRAEMTKIKSVTGSGTDTITLRFNESKISRMDHLSARIDISDNIRDVDGNPFQGIKKMRILDKIEVIVASPVFPDGRYRGDANSLRLWFEGTYEYAGGIWLEIGTYENGSWKLKSTIDEKDVNSSQYITGGRLKDYKTDQIRIWFQGIIEIDDVVRVNFGDQRAGYMDKIYEIREKPPDVIRLYKNSQHCGEISAIYKEVERHTYPPHECEKCQRLPFTTTHYHRITVFPPIKPPITETVFVEHVLLDPYGYEAANKDMTNYVWDPIAIEHIADFDFSKERAGTIRFEYERGLAEEFDSLLKPGGSGDANPDMKPLVEEGGFECEEKSCNGPLKVEAGEPLDATGIGFLPYSYDVTNGGGMYAYTAPELDNAGEYEITYLVSVFNRDELINRHINKAEKQLVASYDPQFSHYEYPVLSDRKKYAYDDRQGMVIKYDGSWGSGKDDNNILNEERRSRINAFYQNTTLYSTGIYHDPIILDSDLLIWDSISHINGTDNTAWFSLWEGVGDGHAMFQKAGYGILRLAQEISSFVFLQENVERFYINSTTYNEIASDRWAGHDSFRNWNYTYQYPHTSFAQWYNMTAYDIHGNYTNSRLIADVVVPGITHNSTNIPDFPDNDDVRIMLDQYIHAKTLHDTGDETFATGVMNETHHLKNNSTGTGTLSMWLDKTALKFPHGYIPGGENGGILNMTRYSTFNMPADIEVTMVSDSTIIKRPFHFTFENDHYHETFILGADSIPFMERITDIRGDSGTIRITVPPNFGEIKRITIDGEDLDTNLVCTPHCEIITRNSGTITIENVWGGTATAEIESATNPEPQNVGETFESTWEYIYYIVVLGFVGFIIYLSLKRVMAIHQEK